MINCFHCHRMHKNGGVYYCPFFDMHPCVRGEHYFNSDEVRPPKFKPEEPKSIVVKVVKKVTKPKMVIPKSHERANGGLGYPLSFYRNPPPKYKPPLNPTVNSINYEPIHDKIFEMFRNGASLKKIGETVGVKGPTLNSYLRRYI